MMNATLPAKNQPLKPANAGPLMRPRAKGSGPCVVINGQSVPWSFIQLLRVKWFGGDWDRVIDCFWKARNAVGSGAVMRYVSRGLVLDPKTGNRYSLLPSKERNEGRMEEIKRWWNGIYTPVVKNVGTAKDAMREMMREILG